jgi:hypothetical protein
MIPPERRRKIFDRVWWGAALAGGALVAADLWIGRGAGDGFRETLLYRGNFVIFWWLMLPAMLALKRRLGSERPWWQLAAAHGAMAGLVIALGAGAETALLLVANGLPGSLFGEVLRDLAGWRGLLQYLLVYGGIIVPVYAAEFYLNWRAGQREAAELKVANAQVETRLVRANLDALKMQLHPHFLFNALNSITALIRRGQGEQAEEAVAKLGGLLRRALDHKQDQFVTLADELEFLDHYFAIERIRFQDRLIVELQAEPDCRAARLPSLVLQPLVENAMKHGFSRASGARHLRLRAWREADRLELELYNDGPPLPAGFTGVGSGIGLRNTRARLEMLYGPRAGLRLRDSPGGVTARVSLPFNT